MRVRVSSHPVKALVTVTSGRAIKVWLGTHTGVVMQEVTAVRHDARQKVSSQPARCMQGRCSSWVSAFEPFIPVAWSRDIDRPAPVIGLLI